MNIIKTIQSNEWLAGLIDGDGHFLISVSFEITTYITDVNNLNITVVIRDP